MTYRRTRFAILLVSAACISLAACARVPREVVDLSYRIGEDLEGVHASYRALVRAHFDGLRRTRLAYLNDEWAPVFIRDFVADGRLVDVAKGAVVWSEEKEDFVTPTKGREQQELLTTIQDWASAAIGQIEQKKAELIDPLDEDEATLITSVDDAFNQIAYGNAAVTAHLNSLRKVQEVQDRALAAANVQQLRDQINAALVKVSQGAEQGLAEVRKADGIVKNLTTIRKKAEDALPRKPESPPPAK